MEAGYRKADMIELHDAQVVVYADDAKAEAIGWRKVPTVKGAGLSVEGNALARLLQALGVTFDADLLYGDEYDVLFRRPLSTMPRTPEPPLEGALRIKELWARPEGERQLHIYVNVASETPEEDEAVQDLMYSGSYTVWWSAAED